MAGADPTQPSIDEPVLIYDRIASNKRETWLLMSLFVVITGALAAGISYALGAPLPVVPIVIAALILYAVSSYYASSNVALGVSGARQVTKEEEPELYRVVENLSIGSGLPVPKVYVIEDSAPNAFATGRDPKHASVAATRGLLNKLDKAELEGVMAHEMSHVGNYDTRVMTITIVLIGIIALLGDFFIRWTWFGAGRRESNRDRGGAAAIVAIVVILFAVIAPVIAKLIQLAISRQREYLADASGALLCRNPDALASALEKISADPDPLEVANKATAHLYFSNPLRDHQSMLNDAFSTHPPVAERIRLLRAM
ncbi:MAG TPA: M48 family metallopeptidase [Dehalococcoidia bacterium]